jgi:hypothetical protein
MKALWKCFSCMAVLVIIVSACSPAAVTPPSTAAAVQETPAGSEVPGVAVPLAPAAAQSPTIKLPLIAKKVSEMPAIDGNANDAAWKDATLLKVGVLTMKAVYDGQDVAFLMVWPDRDMSINSRGTWNWDPSTKAWWQTGMVDGTWDSFKGNRHPEWANIAFDISSVVGSQGCFAFCHEYPPGSGIFHHNTAGAGQYVDSWGLLAKHGYGSKFLQDMGWVLGYSQVTQNGKVTFDTTDTMDPRNVLTGDVTFAGYAEDKVIAPIGDTKYPTTTRPADQYCIKCHQDKGAIDWTKTGNTTRIGMLITPSLFIWKLNQLILPIVWFLHKQRSILVKRLRSLI